MFIVNIVFILVLLDHARLPLDVHTPSTSCTSSSGGWLPGVVGCLGLPCVKKHYSFEGGIATHEAKGMTIFYFKLIPEVKYRVAALPLLQLQCLAAIKRKYPEGSRKKNGAKSTVTIGRFHQCASERVIQPMPTNYLSVLKHSPENVVQLSPA